MSHSRLQNSGAFHSLISLHVVVDERTRVSISTYFFSLFNNIFWPVLGIIFVSYEHGWWYGENLFSKAIPACLPIWFSTWLVGKFFSQPINIHIRLWAFRTVLRMRIEWKNPFFNFPSGWKTSWWSQSGLELSSPKLYHFPLESL